MKTIAFISIVLMSFNANCQIAKRTETVSVNGKKIHYEVYGEGQPLFMLHGYTLSSQSWQPYVKDYTDDYQVYLVDLTGHGKSEAFKEELSIKSVAEDLLSLIQYLELEEIQAIGFSFGGDVLYQLALMEPELIKSMITIGAVGTWSILDYTEYLDAFTFENKDNFPWLETAHESDEQIRALMDQFKNYIVELSNEELQSIKPEVLIMVGDDDEGMDLKEVVRVKQNLPNADLWILPNVSHGAHEGATKEEFIIKSKAFLNKEQ